MLTTYELQIGNRSIQVRSLREASELYCELRDKANLGASEMPQATIWQGNVSVARVSYNGRVWPVAEWTPAQKPIYDNGSGLR